MVKQGDTWKKQVKRHPAIGEVARLYPTNEETQGDELRVRRWNDIFRPSGKKKKLGNL